MRPWRWRWIACLKRSLDGSQRTATAHVHTCTHAATSGNPALAPTKRSAPSQEVVEFCCNLLGKPFPPLVVYDPDSTTVLGLANCYSECRRVHNDLIKDELGITLLYPVRAAAGPRILERWLCVHGAGGQRDCGVSLLSRRGASLVVSGVRLSLCELRRGLWAAGLCAGLQGGHASAVRGRRRDMTHICHPGPLTPGAGRTRRGGAASHTNW